MFGRLWVAVTLSLSAPLQAAPSVFISEGRGESWWNAASMKGSIKGTRIGQVTTAKLNAFIQKTVEYYSYKVCALTEVQNDTYVGVDEATQNDIASTLKLTNWRIAGVTPNGRRVIAQSVLYEDCDDTDNRGAAVLVTDATTSDVMLFAPVGPGERDGKSVPIWTAFLQAPESKSSDTPIFSFSACTECGAATAVYYDVTRKKLYMEYNGH